MMMRLSFSNSSTSSSFPSHSPSNPSPLFALSIYIHISYIYPLCLAVSLSLSLYLHLFVLPFSLYQHDVGHVPPKEVWDVSGMTIEVIKDEVEHMQKLKREKSERSGIESGGDSLRSRGKGAGLVHTLRRILKGNLFTSQASTTKFEEGKEDGEEEGDDIEAGTRKGGENAENVEDEEESIRCDSDRECDGDSNVGASDSDSEEDAKFHPWEWTIVLAHLHRTEDSAETGEDPMKLEIHGLEDHSDHDVEDWRDALSVVLATLNPIALRRAHIKEAILGLRREVAESVRESVSSLATGFRGRKRITSLTKRMEAHGHRQEIICIGYNEVRLIFSSSPHLVVSILFCVLTIFLLLRCSRQFWRWPTPRGRR